MDTFEILWLLSYPAYLNKNLAHDFKSPFLDIETNDIRWYFLRNISIL